MIFSVDKDTRFGAAGGGGGGGAWQDKGCRPATTNSVLDEKKPKPTPEDVKNAGVVSDSDSNSDIQNSLCGFDAADADNVGIVSDSSSDDGPRYYRYGLEPEKEAKEAEKYSDDLTQYRTWTDNTGVYTTFAQFQSCIDGLVCLSKPPGMQKRLGLVRLERLSMVDRKLVEKYERLKAERRRKYKYGAGDKMRWD